MRVRILVILLLTGIAGFPNTPKEPVRQNLNFGFSEFKEALSYENSNFSPILIDEKMSKHLAHLQKRQSKSKNDFYFVEYAFYYIHKKFLKNYQQYATINQTVDIGAYDCVTATAVYSLFFTELEIPFSVIETNYHIYLLLFPGTTDEVLIETTDPVYGFVDNQDEISERKALYAKNNSELEPGQIDLGWEVETMLKGEQLIGVILFNQSIKQFNLGNRGKALELAAEALEYYNSSRIRAYFDFVRGNRLALN